MANSTPHSVLIEKELQHQLTACIHSYCEEVAEELSPRKNPLASTEAKKKQLEAEVTQRLHAYKKRVSEGFSHCLEAVNALAVTDPSIDLDSLKENIMQALSKLDSKESIEAYAEEAVSGSSWSMLVGLNTTTLKTLYRGAEQLFLAGRYSEAEAAFCFLSTVDSTQYAFWIGLGHSCYQEGKFHDAVNAYSMASFCDPFSVWPHIYSANSFEAVDDFAQAVVCLHDAESSLDGHSIRDKNFEEMLRQRIVSLKNRKF